MTVMDLKFFNEDTQQWEMMFANSADLSIIGQRVVQLVESVDDVQNRYGRVPFVISDWNSIEHSGTYMGVDILNAPVNNLWVLAHYIAHNVNWGVLKARTLSSPSTEFYRVKQNAQWGPWVECGQSDAIKTPQIGIWGPDSLTKTLDNISGSLYTPHVANVYTFICNSTVPATSTGIYDIFISVNPNTAGSRKYRSVIAIRSAVVCDYDPVTQQVMFRVESEELTNVGNLQISAYVTFTDNITIENTTLEESVASSCFIRVVLTGDDNFTANNTDAKVVIRKLV